MKTPSLMTQMYRESDFFSMAITSTLENMLFINQKIKNTPSTNSLWGFATIACYRLCCLKKCTLCKHSIRCGARRLLIAFMYWKWVLCKIVVDENASNERKLPFLGWEFTMRWEVRGPAEGNSPVPHGSLKSPLSILIAWNHPVKSMSRVLVRFLYPVLDFTKKHFTDCSAK